MRELLNRHLLEVAIAKIVPAFAGMGFIAIAAQLCAPADYGQFALAFATSNLVAVVAAVWLYQSVLRYAGTDAGARRLVGITAVAIASTAVVCAVQWLLAHRGSTELGATAGPDQAWAVPVLAFALTLNMVAGGFATATQHFREYRLAEVARGAMLLGLAALAGWAAPGARGLVLAYALGTALPSLLLLVWLNRLLPRPSESTLQGLRSVMKQFILYGWPMTLWAGLQASQSLIERRVLGHALDAETFGRFLAVSDMLTRGIGLTLMPVVTMAHVRLMNGAAGRTRLDPAGRQLLRQSAGLIVAAGSVLSVLVLLFRPVLATLVPAITDIDLPTLALVCVAALAWTLALIVHKPLELANQTLRMAALLGVVVALQAVLLQAWVSPMQQRAMPMAALVAALVYITGCMLLSKSKVQL